MNLISKTKAAWTTARNRIKAARQIWQDDAYEHAQWYSLRHLTTGMKPPIESIKMEVVERTLWGEDPTQYPFTNPNPADPLPRFRDYHSDPTWLNPVKVSDRTMTLADIMALGDRHAKVEPYRKTTFIVHGVLPDFINEAKDIEWTAEPDERVTVVGCHKDIEPLINQCREGGFTVTGITRYPELYGDSKEVAEIRYMALAEAMPTDEALLTRIKQLIEASTR